MKIAAPPSPPLPTPAAAAAQRGREPGREPGQERGPFQQLVQRLEQDMWSGAAAGAVKPGATPESGGAAASPRTAAPAQVRPLAYLRDPGLPAGATEPMPRPALRDIVEAGARAAATALALAPPAARDPGIAFATFVAPPPSTRTHAASASRAASEAPHAFATVAAPPPEQQQATGERLSLLAAPGGFGIALRLREDRPPDPDLLRRALARVLHEHGASLMRLTINGTDARFFQGGTRHGD